MFCSSQGSYIRFYDKFYITTIEKLSFHLDHVMIIISIYRGKTRNDCFHDNASRNDIKFKKNYAENPQQNDQYRNEKSTLG